MITPGRVFSNTGVRTRNGQHHNDPSRIAQRSRNRSDLIAERDVCIELFWLLALEKKNKGLNRVLIASSLTFSL